MVPHSSQPVLCWLSGDENHDIVSVSMARARVGSRSAMLTSRRRRVRALVKATVVSKDILNTLIVFHDTGEQVILHNVFCNAIEAVALCLGGRQDDATASAVISRRHGDLKSMSRRKVKLFCKIAKGKM